MILKAGEIINRTMLTKDTGEDIGKIRDVIYDSSEHKILAFLVHGGGIFSEAEVVLFHDISSIGHDRVIINSKSSIKPVSEVNPRIAEILKDNTNLTRTKVITEQGNDLGILTDLFFDTDSAAVEEFEVSQGTLEDVRSGKKRINIRDIITYGKDSTIVRSNAEQEIVHQAQEQGLQGALNKGKEAVKNAGERIGEGVQEARDNIQSRVEQGGEKLDDYAQQARTESSSNVSTSSNRMSDVVDNIRKSEGPLNTNLNNISERVSQGIGALTDKVKDLGERTKQEAEKMNSQIKEEENKDLVGRYLEKNILLPNDEVIARRGDVITYELLRIAEENGIRDQIRDNSAI